MYIYPLSPQTCIIELDLAAFDQQRDMGSAMTSAFPVTRLILASSRARLTATPATALWRGRRASPARAFAER
jgi:hypothetical protein